MSASTPTDGSLFVAGTTSESIAVSNLFVSSGIMKSVKPKLCKVLIPDSGATHSITCNKKYYVPGSFTTNCPKMRFKVVANNTIVESQGRGKIMVPLRDMSGTIHQVLYHDVYYVPSQPYSLLSIAQCIRDGWESPDFKEYSWQAGSWYFPIR